MNVGDIVICTKKGYNITRPGYIGIVKKVMRDEIVVWDEKNYSDFDYFQSPEICGFKVSACFFEKVVKSIE